MCNADVGGIDVAIDVEIRDVAVLFFADVIRQPSDCEQVRRTVELDAVFERKALACEDFVRDGLQFRVS